MILKVGYMTVGEPVQVPKLGVEQSFESGQYHIFIDTTSGIAVIKSKRQDLKEIKPTFTTFSNIRHFERITIMADINLEGILTKMGVSRSEKPEQPKTVKNPSSDEGTSKAQKKS